MFIANDSNYTFGQFLAVEDGDDIKAPVYSKCFTDTEALKGYRFIHDPEETDPEKCVCFSIYNETSSAALATPFKEYASVSDLTSVMFRLDTEIVEGHLREVPYYHVIVPVQNIKDDTLKYLVIMMTKEVELFPENYPYYELVSTFAGAEPTSAEAPGGVTPTGTITITENDTYDVTNYASAAVNVPGITPTGTLQITENDTYDVTNYASAEVNVSAGSGVFTTCTVTLSEDLNGDFGSADFICGYEIFDTDPLLAALPARYLDDDPNIITAALVDGKQCILTAYAGQGSPVVSGNAVYDSSTHIITITGNCTIKAFTNRT